jgi:hypothetical protein
MKWYWAILLTLLIFAADAAALHADPSGGKEFIHLICAISGIWAAGKSSSFGWGLFVFFLWPIGFPCFLISRYKPACGLRGESHATQAAAEGSPGLVECPRCNSMIPPGEPKCPKCGWP